MSHFSVAVIHFKDQTVAELLKPYDENTVVKEYIRYTKPAAIAYAKENFNDSVKDKTDQELWEIMADGCKTDKEGNIYSTYNPLSKWDWWEVGGRWDKCIKTKDGVMVNEARIKDIDANPDQKTYEDALDFWEVAIAKTKKSTKGKDYSTFYNDKYFLDYYGNAETYAKSMANFTTYAVVTPDGVWHSCGNMGWFGCSDETPNQARDWNANYKDRFIDGMDGDLVLTMVDCHI